MVRPNRNLALAWPTRWIRLAARVAIMTTLSVWSLGTLHETEHIDRDEPPACSNCIAVTDDELAHTSGPLLEAVAAITAFAAQSPATRPQGAKEFRLTARAPPQELT